MSTRKRKSGADEPIPNWGWASIACLLFSLLILFMWGSGVFRAIGQLFSEVQDPAISIASSLLGLAAIFLIYFLPSVIAYKTPRAAAIIATNFLLGWTGIGWIIAFIWSLAEAGSMNKSTPPPSYRP